MGVVEIATLVSMGASLIEKFRSAGTPAATSPTPAAIGGILNQLLALGMLKKDDIKAGNLPATFGKIESAAQAAEKLLGLARDLVGPFTTHDLPPDGRNPRPRLAATADGNLVLDAQKTFRFWADESSLPEVFDDRKTILDALSDAEDGRRDNENFGIKSRDIARIAYHEAWLEWLDRLGVKAVDSYSELLSQNPHPSETEKDAEKKRANVIVKTVNNLPETYRALTSVGPGGQASRGLEMELNGKMTWTYSEFKGTVAHEIGHLLGLDDEDNETLLMSGVYSHVNEPQQGDIQAAKQHGWKLA